MGEMAEVSIGSQEQLARVPEYNALAKLNGIMHFAGTVTETSRIAGQQGDIERPMTLRNRRSELYKAAMKSDRPQRKELFKEAHVRDEIAREYLNQGVLKVTLPGLGTQEATYTTIDPPESQRTLETSGKPPIFLIPGAANDIDAVGNIVQELPYMGRSVTVVGMPDATLGKVTDQFAQSVAEDTHYKTHTDFYKQAIDALVGREGDFELWGFSTGAPISAEILSDPEYQRRVPNAVFISPASTIDQTTLQLGTGAVSESQKLLRRFRTLPRYSLVLPKGSNSPEDKLQQAINKKATNGILEKVKQRLDIWDDARVREGGNIVVVAGGRDELTKCHKGLDVFEENPQTKILDLPDASHMTPITKASQILPQIFQLQAAMKKT